MIFCHLLKIEFFRLSEMNIYLFISHKHYIEYDINKITMCYFCLKPLATGFTLSVCRVNTVLLTVASDMWGSRTPRSCVCYTRFLNFCALIFSNANFRVFKEIIYVYTLPFFFWSSPWLNPLCICLGCVCVCVDSWASLKESGLHSNEISLPS